MSEVNQSKNALELLQAHDRGGSTHKPDYRCVGEKVHNEAKPAKLQNCHHERWLRYLNNWKVILILHLTYCLFS